MRDLLVRLWHDQSGEASGIAVILLYTILALGATTGLVTLRNQIVQEYGDLAVALDALNQSWGIPGGASYTDDDSIFTNDPADPVGAPADITFIDPTGEGSM